MRANVLGKTLLDEIKGKMTPEEAARYKESTEEARVIIASTSDPIAVSQLGGEISAALLGAEQLGIIKFSDAFAILKVVQLAFMGMEIADKYIPKEPIDPKAN